MPSAQYLPVGQGRHDETATPFSKELYVPAKQGISSPLGQYLPARQLKQCPEAADPSALYFPGGHLVAVADAKGQYEPAGHVVQDEAVAPTLLRNVPASQFVGAVIPATGQRVPGGHCRQTACDVAD